MFGEAAYNPQHDFRRLGTVNIATRRECSPKTVVAEWHRVRTMGAWVTPKNFELSRMLQVWVHTATGDMLRPFNTLSTLRRCDARY